MRIVSLIASATEIVAALGFEDQLVARSHECDYPESVRGLPVVTQPRFAHSRLVRRDRPPRSGNAPRRPVGLPGRCGPAESAAARRHRHAVALRSLRRQPEGRASRPCATGWKASRGSCRCSRTPWPTCGPTSARWPTPWTPPHRGQQLIARLEHRLHGVVAAGAELCRNGPPSPASNGSSR